MISDDAKALVELSSLNGRISWANFTNSVKLLRAEHGLTVPQAIEYIENELTLLKIIRESPYQAKDSGRAMMVADENGEPAYAFREVE